LITISTSLDAKLLHQNLVNKKIKALLQSIHPDFHTANPILSGSYLIKLVVAPEANYNDYDFYFTNKNDFDKASAILNEAYPNPKKTKNSTSYTLDSNFSTQAHLIFKEFNSPQNIILAHDFKNCQIAWFNNDLYFSNAFKQAWKDKELGLSLNQLPEFDDHNAWLAKLTVIVQRVKKYVERYNLAIDSDLLSLLSESRKLLFENSKQFSTFDFSMLNHRDRDYFTTQSEEDKIFSLPSLQQTIKDLIEG
jgi:hypothetical protein